MSLYSCGFVLSLLLINDLSLTTLVISNYVLDCLLFQKEFWWNLVGVRWGSETPGLPGWKSSSCITQERVWKAHLLGGDATIISVFKSSFWQHCRALRWRAESQCSGLAFRVIVPQWETKPFCTGKNQDKEQLCTLSPSVQLQTSLPSAGMQSNWS